MTNPVDGQEKTLKRKDGPANLFRRNHDVKTAS
jgi:hypothetical protein